MATITLLDKKGKKSTKKQDLNEALFGLEPNCHLIYLAKIRQESNARRGTAHSKTRPEVRGGGAKPWKQKGTGRARAGSKNSPLWRGGGVIFGPRNNINWTKGMNRKESTGALLHALNLAQQEAKILAIESVNLENAKTKEFATIIKEAGLENKNVIFVVEADNSKLALIVRAARNLVGVKVLSTITLNVKDLLKADHIVFTTEALKQTEQRFSPLVKA